jgi:hypothetical protein
MSNIPTTTGGITPFEQPKLPAFDRAAFAANIKKAKDAKPTEFKDVTPIYWEAQRDEEKTLAFVGFKTVNKIDEKTGEIIGEKIVAVLHDGDRPVIMGQVAAVEAFGESVQGQVYRVKCLSAEKKAAKKFQVLEFQA